ncbi:hypothetical protein PROFUN_08496 [Planoprotostelium fungivorum]|uniref:AB hydrolase-1 domain-containing protein n=1 Tax=Planoprotostelium fungivorum TaxID=1890364 RepID=A0A2P6NJB5_9EUKA|nr:hypothetical protein PROFUN_08496 [Planoprotostelium fungivorum]
MSQKKTFHIKTEDGFQLSAILFTPKEETKHSGSFILLNCATGVPALFYAPFALWVSSRGTPILIWDYRLTGSSFPSHIDLKDEAAIIQLLQQNKDVSITKEWATDYRAVLAAAVDLSRGKDLIVVGHSLGAHIVAAGLPAHRNAVKRYVFVGGTNPHFETSPSAPALEMWKEMAYQQRDTQGYYDGRSIMAGGLFPMGVGLEWVGWTMNPDSNLYVAGAPLMREDGRQLDLYAQHLGKSLVTKIMIDPETAGYSSAMGHVNSFKKNKKDNRGWEDLEDIILKGVRGSEGKNFVVSPVVMLASRPKL